MSGSLVHRFAPAPALVFLLLCSGCAGIMPWKKPPLTLVWYGLARQGASLYPTYHELEDGVTLATGDGVQLFLTIRPSAYLYVLHQTAAGEFALWWPAETHGFNAMAEEGRVQTLPSRGRVYTMEVARGTEAIYIIAARKPINTVDKLTRELRWLFVTTQALAADVPPSRIREIVPRNLEWEVDLADPNPVAVVDQRVPIATTVKAIGALRKSEEQWVSTAEGGTYVVQAEQLYGKDVIARVIRVHRTISRDESE